MGISKEVYETTGGFKFDRFAEDIELSIRIRKAGFVSVLIPDAFVYHKRRSSLKQFFWQVYNFGRGRVQVGRAHPGEVKISHWFPLIFLAGILAIPFVAFFNQELGLFMSWLYILYLLFIAMDAFIKSRSILIAFLSIPAALVQLIGYALGFLKEMFSGRS